MAKLSGGEIATIVGAIVVLAGIGVVMYMAQSRNDAYVATTFVETKAKAPANPKVCVAKSDNPKLKVPYVDQTDIVNIVSSSIIDVPAGTNVSVYLGTYNGSKSTGSIIYDGNYGTYNFSVTRKADTSASFGTINWTVDTFVACKQ